MRGFPRCLFPVQKDNATWLHGVLFCCPLPVGRHGVLYYPGWKVRFCITKLIPDLFSFHYPKCTDDTLIHETPARSRKKRGLPACSLARKGMCITGCRFIDQSLDRTCQFTRLPAGFWYYIHLIDKWTENPHPTSFNHRLYHSLLLANQCTTCTGDWCVCIAGSSQRC